MARRLTTQQALDLWRNTVCAGVRDDSPDLSARQIAILLTVYQTPPPHTVRGLSADLKVSKPAITRALDALGKLGFVRRRKDDADRRSVLVQRTVKGSVFLSELAEHITASLSEAGMLDNGRGDADAKP
jgi:DNA-binding MarR family transcriptional regulator